MPAPGSLRPGARAAPLVVPGAKGLRGGLRGGSRGHRTAKVHRPVVRPGSRGVRGGRHPAHPLAGTRAERRAVQDRMAPRGPLGQGEQPAGGRDRPQHRQHRYGVPGGSSRVGRLADRADPGRSHHVHRAPRTRELVPGRSRGLLEDLHARRVSGGPVRAAVRAAVLPVPPVGVRRHGRGDAAGRPRLPPAPPAAPGGRRRRVPRGPARLHRARWARLLERGPRLVITKRLARWFDDRLGASSFARSALNKVFPDHWSFMLGEIALYAFVVLVLTGTYLAFFFSTGTQEVVYHGSYVPLRGVHMSEAYASVVRLSFDVRAGLVMRQTHHWAANLFVAAIVLHLCRIFFTGAFRRPREINWIIGVTLLLLGIFNGFSGYSMPDDLLSGTGLRIAYSIALSIPLVGTWIAFLTFGGEVPADQIIHLLFILHVFIVPALLATLIGVHLALIWHQKHTQFPGKGRTESNVVGSRLYPTYTAKSVGLFFAVAAVLAGMGGLFQINPIWLYGPFEPSSVLSPAQPDWYLGWL